MASVDELLIAETIWRNRLEKSIDNGKKTPIARRTLGYYENKMTELKKLWNEYSEIDLKINTKLLQSPSDPPHEYVTNETYSVTEAKYSEYLGEVVDLMRKLTPSTDTVKPDIPIHTTTVVQQESFLPRIELPKYNGDYDLWRSFHDLFVSLVHDNKKLTPVQKLHHLKSCLVGDAEKLLRHTPVTNEDYLPAWIKLKGRYENKRILVNHQLKTLVNQPKLNSESAKGLKALIDTTDECMQQLKSLDVDTTSWDILLIHLLVQKLPFLTLKLWEEEQGGSQELPSLTEFENFLTTRLRILESIADSLVKPTPTKSSNSHKEITKSYHTTKQITCPLCDASHFIQRCSRYRQMDIPTRYKTLKTAGRCLNCLGIHTTNNCTSKHRCLKCNKRHHTTLHENNNREQPKSSQVEKEDTTFQPRARLSSSQVNQSRISSNEFSPTLQSVHSTDSPSTSQNFVTRENHNALLATALVVAQSQGKKPQVLRCLIDSGSQSSFITEEACRRLGATLSSTAVSITGLNTSPTAISRHQTTLTLRSKEPKVTQTIEERFLILKRITDHLPSRIISKEECSNLSKLSLADPTFWKPGRIDALLGARVYALILRTGIRQGSHTTPTAINTMFGWILLGSTQSETQDSTSSFAVMTDDIALQLRRFWEMEEVPTNPILTQEEIECQRTYQETHKRLQNGCYQVKLPFVDNKAPILGYSRPQAIKRYQGLQRRFATDKELERDYEECLDEYITLGHMEEIAPPSYDEPHYYIPHHAVVKESTTTKVRVVFDASAKTSNGKSLNDYLLNGPVLQPKLFATLLNWRKYKIAMNADIEKMYRMIAVHPDHRTFQRIVWRHPNTKKIQDYQIKTVTFGTSSAPYLAIQTLQQLAIDEKGKWPLASKVTTTDFYVDDLLTGADNLMDAKRLQQELRNMLESGGFNLRKWTSNSSDLLRQIPVEQREFKEALTISETETVKTLGIKWHPTTDNFSFVIKPWATHATTTKRTVLSDVASLYDPLGWLAPIVINAKVLMQSLWVTGCTWDNPVSEPIRQQWDRFKQDLSILKDLRIPRWIHYTTGAHIQIHGFCDASIKAFAAVVYLRVEIEDGVTQTNLLTAKTRVAPTKPTTIPRLELNGAVLLTRLITATIKDMRLEKVPVIAWTDSTIVLQWIKEHPARWKTYVANRVVEIQDSVPYDHWRHISTKHNPADLASRGVTTENLMSNNLWWHGPAWLSNDQVHWPICSNPQEQTILEAKTPDIMNFLGNFENDILLRYSSFTRLLRVVAMIQRFIHNCRNVQCKRLQFLDSQELNQAEITILKLTQQTAFSKDYSNMLQNIPLSQQSKLIKFNPFIDDSGLIRLGGRLDNASIPTSQKHPIILPKDHHVTLLLIDKLHIETMHGGPSLVLSTSRERYWILDGRRCITSRLHKCITCFKRRTTSRMQLMGNLPRKHR